MASAKTSPKPPLWNQKSMARYLAGRHSSGENPGTETAAAGDPPEDALPTFALDAATLSRLGLKAPPKDPRLLAEFLLAEDAADGALDADEFARGVRRAVRISLALSAKLHQRSGQPWKRWVEAQFKVGYACFHRYHVAAQLQVGLIARKLPLLENEYQSRALAPFRRHEKFWSVVSSFREGLPPAQELKARVPALLGLKSPAMAGARVKLHRILSWVLRTNDDEDDPAVHEALELVREAIALLEKGSA